jgi:hypothetical protein
MSEKSKMGEKKTFFHAFLLFFTHFRKTKVIGAHRFKLLQDDVLLLGLRLQDDALLLGLGQLVFRPLQFLAALGQLVLDFAHLRFVLGTQAPDN